MPDVLRIVADRNIPGLAEAAAMLAEQVELTLLPASAITAATVRDAELLFIRSTVRADAALLGESRVRFLATATSGTDHLDLPWLSARGIQVASAPGCNADAVVQWLAAALCHLLVRLGHLPGWDRPLFGTVAGVVGVGQVGGRVARLLEAMGARVLRCDPPRQRAGEAGPFHELDELCQRCDLLTLHVPLTFAGPDRTAGLLDARRLQALPRHAVIINSARGEVLAEDAAPGPAQTLILDVFPGEPAPAPELVRRAALATPHIAGHSLEGKVRGTQQVYEAACRFLGVAPRWAPDATLLPPNPLSGMAVAVKGRSNAAVLCEILERSYDIAADAAALRRIVEGGGSAAERGAAFRHYRDTYPVRRELTGAQLLIDEPRRGLQEILHLLGAGVSVKRQGTELTFPSASWRAEGKV